MRTVDDGSFLSILLEKGAAMHSLGTLGINTGAALNEVRRQIAQATTSNVITGDGVTKSDKNIRE